VIFYAVKYYTNYVNAKLFHITLLGLTTFSPHFCSLFSSLSQSKMGENITLKSPSLGLQGTRELEHLVTMDIFNLFSGNKGTLE